MSPLIRSKRAWTHAGPAHCPVFPRQKTDDSLSPQSYEGEASDSC